MSSAFSPTCVRRRTRKASRSSSHAEHLENEGILAPNASTEAYCSTKRERTFNTQRFTPKALAPLPNTLWTEDDYQRSSSALSQTTTVAPSFTSKASRSAKERFLTFYKSPRKFPKQDSFDVETVDQPLRSKSRRRLLDGFRPGSKRKAADLQPLQPPYTKDFQSGRDVDSIQPHYHLAAPAPNFGDIPGVGYEKARPQFDLSTGAAARAAAAAQNELLENMRRMNLRDQNEVQDSESGIGIESGDNRTFVQIPVIRRDPIPMFPTEIVMNIFAYLDAESVINCELVSTAWRHLASAKHTWKRIFQSQVRTPTHRAFTEFRHSEEEAYPEVSWKKRWQVHKALCRRWTDAKAGVFYLEGHTDNIYCVQFDDEKIVTGSKDRTIRIWNTRSKQCAHVLGVPTKAFDGLGMDKLPTDVHPVPISTCFSRFREQVDTEALPFFHDGSILCLQYDDRIMVTGSSDSTIIIWKKVDTYRFDPIKRLTEHTKGVLDVCFDEENIVSCSKDNDICLFRRNDGLILRKLTGHRGPVNAVKMKGDIIVSASGDGLVKLWNRTSGLCIKEFSSSSRGLACVELSLDSRAIWAGGNDHDIYEFDANTGMLARKLGAHTNLVRSLYLDGNSGRLVSGSYDNNIKIFDTHSKHEICRLRNWSASWILSAKSDYRRIVATSQDKRVMLIDFGHGLTDIDALDPGGYRLCDDLEIRCATSKV